MAPYQADRWDRKRVPTPVRYLPCRGAGFGVVLYKLIATMKRPVQMQPSFYYCIQIENREFLVAIAPDGSSQWDDHTGRRTFRHPQNRNLELSAFAGDKNALRQLQNECLEFIISVPVPNEIVTKAMELAELEAKQSPYISKSLVKGIKEMDDLLIAFFWEAVNPLSAQPIN